MARHYTENRHANPVPSVVFVALVMAMLLMPFAGMVVAPTTQSAEKKELAEFPSLTLEDGTPNTSYLAQWGDWFEDHYAFRNQIVDAGAQAKASVLGESAVSNVVVGTEGWLYYAGTLADYQLTSPMSDRALFNAAHNLSLVQEFVQTCGANFVVAIAPNKASLYPGHMPYYELAGEGQSNAERLGPLLNEMGVNYVDLFEVLGAQDETLYLATDTHWSDTGACIAYNALADALGHAHDDLSGAEVGEKSVVGDLAQMVTPLSAQPEAQPDYSGALGYMITNDATSVEDSTIETVSTTLGASGSLVMYRDSFGNALLPFMASSYSRASFSKLIPYNLMTILERGASDVVILRAERHLAMFATKPPYMPSPEREATVVAGATQMATETDLQVCFNGPYLQLVGSVDGRYVQDDSIVYAILGDGPSAHVYECFTLSSSAEQVADVEGEDTTGDDVVGDNGYKAFILESAIVGSSDDIPVRIVVSGSSGCVEVYSDTITLSDVTRL